MITSHTCLDSILLLLQYQKKNVLRLLPDCEVWSDYKDITVCIIVAYLIVSGLRASSSEHIHAT